MANTQSDPRSAGPKPPFPKQAQAGPGSAAALDPKADYGEATYRGSGKLQGRVALITGADSGIGRAVALAFAREGADIAVAYLDEHEDARETERLVHSAGKKCLLLPGDLTSEAQCTEVIDETIAQLGKIDLLINNAASQGKSVEAFEELTSERVEKTLKTNVLAMFNLSRLVLKTMKAGGSIINTSSIQGYQPDAGILDYAVTKAAIVAFTKGLAQSLIERGIRVNSVAPGPVWTPLPVSSYTPEKNAKFGEQSPMGRPAQPAELAPAYVFLASDESRFVNGEILGVTGGKPLM